MALFYLLTIYASIRALSSPRASIWRAIAILSCALGMASKESMVTAPLMVILYDRAFVYGSLKQAVQARGRLYAGLLLTWVLLAALILSGPRAAAGGFSTGVRPWTYLLNQTVMIARYLRLAVWPRSLVAFYGWPLALSLGDVVPYALFIAALLVLTMAWMVRSYRLAFLGVWFFLTLALTSSIVPIATEVGAERRMYLPLMALVVLVVIGGSLLWDLAKRRGFAGALTMSARTASVVGVVVLAIVSTALGAGTVARNREYASGISLARTVLERRPTSIAHHMLGEQLMVEGRHDEAIKELQEAAQGDDSRAHYVLGMELFNQGRPDEAVPHLEAFIRTADIRLVPRWLEPSRAEVISSRLVIGQAFFVQQRWSQAADQFSQIIKVAPTHAEARALLAEALFRQASFGEAIAQYREYLKVRPDDPDALSNLGIALAATEKLDEAISVFRRAVEVAPDNSGAHRNLATALFDARDIAGMALHAQQAVTLNAGDPVAHDLLGRALALQGKFDDARVQFDRSLQIDPTYEQAREDLRQILQLRR